AQRNEFSFGLAAGAHRDLDHVVALIERSKTDIGREGVRVALGEIHGYRERLASLVQQPAFASIERFEHRQLDVHPCGPTELQIFDGLERCARPRVGAENRRRTEERAGREEARHWPETIKNRQRVVQAWRARGGRKGRDWDTR